MAFITEEDLISAIREEELNQLIREDAAASAFAIDAAIEEMKPYLQKYYNVDTIFAQTGDNRNKLLMNFAIDIAIYILISVALPGQDLEDRRARYKRAIDWLKQISKGEITANLPRTDTPENSPNNRGFIGVHTKRENYY